MCLLLARKGIFWSKIISEVFPIFCLDWMRKQVDFLPIKKLVQARRSCCYETAVTYNDCVAKIDNLFHTLNEVSRVRFF